MEASEDMSKVTSYKLTQEEIEQMQQGEKTYDEIIANKQPLEHTADLSVLTKESYKALMHEGYNSFYIREKFNLKTFELDELKKEWGLRNENDWRKNKAIINIDKVPRSNHKSEPKKEEVEVKEIKTKLTKELLEQHKKRAYVGCSDTEKIWPYEWSVLL